MLLETKAERRERKRERAIYFLQQGKSISYTAKVTKKSKKTIYRWILVYKRKGSNGLRSVPSNGRPPKLTEKQVSEASDVLKKMSEGYFSKEKHLTINFVADLIKKKFNVNYHPNYVWKLLRRMNWKYEKYKDHGSSKIKKVSSADYRRGNWRHSWL